MRSYNLTLNKSLWEEWKQLFLSNIDALQIEYIYKAKGFDLRFVMEEIIYNNETPATPPFAIGTAGDCYMYKIIYNDVAYIFTCDGALHNEIIAFFYEHLWANTAEIPTEQEAEHISLSNEDINSILQEHGVSLPQTEETTENTAEEAIPTNDVLLVEESTARFSGAQWFDIAQSKNILLAGLGGIGSWTAVLLSRLHPNTLHLYDNDRVEEVNMAGQLYGKSHIGVLKGNAIAYTIRDFSDYGDVFFNHSLYTEESATADIMICGFDNMQARRVFFTNWKKHVEDKDEEEKSSCLFIDGRLSAELLQVFAIQGDNLPAMEMYEKNYLFDDSKAIEEPCSYKQTSFCASMIGSIITNLFVNFCTNQSDPLFPRPLPFFTQYDAQLLYLKTENV